MTAFVIWFLIGLAAGNVLVYAMVTYPHWRRK